FIPESLLPRVNYKPVTLGFFMLLALFPLSWIPIKYNRPSVLIQWVLYFVVIIPTMIFPYLTIEYPVEKFLLLNIVLLFCFFILCSFNKIPLIRFKKLKLSPIIFYIIFFAFYFFCIAGLIRTFGFNFSFVSLRDVYEVRSDFKDQLE